jgi:hypothetical protein
VTVVNGSWHDLPDPESPEDDEEAASSSGLSRARRIFVLLLATAAIAAATVVVSLGQQFGVAAQILSSLLVTAALGLLASVGISIDTVRKFVETSNLINRSAK